MRALRILSGAIMLAGLLAPAAQAQDVAEVRRLTIMTFSQPVQLPGLTLPAGKYRFEMADINNAAHTVRILSEDGQKVLGTFHTIPTTQPTRDLRDTDTLVMFAERPAGQPQAAKEWYYPQRSLGEEFVYPKAQALAIARANNTSVAAEEDGKITRVEATEAVAVEAPPAPRQEQVAAAEPDPRPAPAPEPARTVGTAGQAPEPAPAPARTLPRTASNFYLYELLSVLLIAAALGVRQLRARASAR